jgi:hypothetical protein
LWPAQRSTLQTIKVERLTVILKARQLGLTWLVLAYALWLMLFHPAATVLLFSKRDDEATDLLGFRLRGMYERLPEWLRCRGVLASAAHEWELSNGSRALAFPTTGGRSYTATLAIIDEADFVPDLDALLNAVKPTIDAGGQMILLSTVDKRRPESTFKRYYIEAREEHTKWRSVFLPWSTAPWRTPEWYAETRTEKLATTGSEDDLWQEYPATDTEALAAKTLDKRFAPGWLERCYAPSSAIQRHDGPAIPGLEIYRLPEAGHQYLIGADPAEGNPTSDDSALTVLDRDTAGEVAALAGKYEPAVFSSYLTQIGMWYKRAGTLVERNNHGHAVLLELRNLGKAQILNGQDGKPGWLTVQRSKALAYDNAAETLRKGAAVIRSFRTMTQLGAIDGATLAAPEGQHDDRAMSFVLALQAMNTGKTRAF